MRASAGPSGRRPTISPGEGPGPHPQRDRLQKDLNDITGGVYTERRNQVVANTEKAALATAQADFDRLDEEGRRNGWPRG